MNVSLDYGLLMLKRFCGTVAMFSLIVCSVVGCLVGGGG